MRVRFGSGDAIPLCAVRRMAGSRRIFVGAVLADLRLWRGDPDGIAQPLVAVELDADLLRQRGDWRRVRIFHQLVHGGCVRYSRVGLHGSMAVD